MSETYSFDVFDTCLVRRYACPSDVFLELGKGWSEILQPVLGTDYIEVFREARVEAERIALEKSNSEETTLSAIWHELAGMFPTIDADEGVRRELLLESDALIAVAKTYEEVENARMLGRRIVFISDTYLPLSFIRDQLASAGFLKDGDSCYVSSEIGKTKRHGSLYLHVLEDLLIQPAQLYHHGDNPSSDVAIPRKLGIKARLIQITQLNNLECHLAQSLPPTCDVWAGRLVGEMRAFRVGRDAIDFPPSISSISAGLIGPILSAMALWVLRQAERDGVNRLYFFSRDGYALHRVAKELAAHLGLPIQCRYLHVSRQALLLPSTSQISPSGMPWLRRHFEVPKIRLLAGKLELPTELMVTELHELVGFEGGDFVIKTEEQWDFFWKTLSKGKLAALLGQKIENRRQILLTYLRQEGLFAEGPLGCVDLGWFQSCQAALVAVCRSVVSNLEVKGYYLSLAQGRGPYLNLGSAQAILHQAPYDRRSLSQAQPAIQNATLLEHILSCAPHGTVHHYEPTWHTDDFSDSCKVVPSCGPTFEEEQRIKKELLDATLIFAGRMSFLALLPTETVKEIVNTVLRISTNWPEPCWFPLLESMTASSDQNNQESRPLVCRSKLWNAVLALIQGRRFSSLGLAETGLWPRLTWLAMPRATRLVYQLAEKSNAAKRKLRGVNFS